MQIRYYYSEDVDFIQDSSVSVLDGATITKWCLRATEVFKKNVKILENTWIIFSHTSCKQLLNQQNQIL